MISSDDPRGVKARRRTIGLAFLLILSLLVWLSIAIYQKQFTDTSTVTLETRNVGNEMHEHADVKLRGVVIGEVRKISADGHGAKLTLAIQPDQIHRLPANVTAQMLPTTLFGERFVALVPPPQPSPQVLTAGANITEDRTSNAVELQQVLDNTLPLLTAVPPDKLSATLTAVAQALQGRGTELGTSLVQFDDYLSKINPTLPQFNQDIHELVRVAQNYSQAAPDILQALTDFSVTSRTLVNQRRNFADLYQSVTSSSRDITQFLRANENNIIRLNADSRPNLQILGRYAPEFPCMFQMLAGFVPAIDKALGKGTREHGLHVSVKVVPSLGPYLAGKDTPVYNAPDIGPHCYSVPFNGLYDDSRLGWATADAGPPPVTQAGLGLPNSPGENHLVNELLAAQSGGAPQAQPDWSSVLVGGFYRGSDVSLR